MKYCFSVLAFTLLFTISDIAAYAQRGGSHGGPPPQAFTACEGKTEGVDCSINTPHGALRGICRNPPHESAMVCIPEGHSHGRNHRGAGQRIHSPRGQLSDRQRDRGYSSGAATGRQRGGGHLREHKTVQAGELQLLPASEVPTLSSYYSSKIEGEWRVLSFNAIPNHKVGQFPNAGNPNKISEQSFTVKVPATPQYTGVATRVKEPGVAVNGVPFDPGAGEFYLGDRNAGWQYEALSGAIVLGLDENHAHVQPTGKYHYHGLPLLLLKSLGINETEHSAQIGWAVDGFPIYALYGYKESKSFSPIIQLQSSYHVKQGKRPSGQGQPGGMYDGTFVADYEYIKGSGDLDECNGRWTVTPEYPNGTYAYFLTITFPVVPRCVMGAVSSNNLRRPI